MVRKRTAMRLMSSRCIGGRRVISVCQVCERERFLQSFSHSIPAQSALNSMSDLIIISAHIIVIPFLSQCRSRKPRGYWGGFYVIRTLRRPRPLGLLWIFSPEARLEKGTENVDKMRAETRIQSSLPIELISQSLFNAARFVTPL